MVLDSLKLSSANSLTVFKEYLRVFWDASVDIKKFWGCLYISPNTKKA